MRITAGLGVSLLAIGIALATALPALAQYQPNAPKGYKLSKVAAADALAVAAPQPLVLSAGSCSGLVLDGMFRVKGGMSRFYEPSRARGGESPTLTEYALAPAGAHKPSTAAPQQYASAGQPVYIGLGTTVAKRGEPVDYVVASYAAQPGGGVQEITRFTLGEQYGLGVYALDLTGNGALTLVCPFSTGASGGGIDLRTLTPDGRFDYIGHSELDSELSSAGGYVNLLDFDGDGDWEIETTGPVLCSACGYYYNELYEYDKEAGNYAPADRRFPQYYAAERGFYRALNDDVKKLAARPADFAYSGHTVAAKYAAQIGAQWYSLDAFFSDPASGHLDQTWVSTLAHLVSGWK